MMSVFRIGCGILASFAAVAIGVALLSGSNGQDVADVQHVVPSTATSQPVTIINHDALPNYPAFAQVDQQAIDHGNVSLVAYQEPCGNCGNCQTCESPGPVKVIQGVDQNTCRGLNREPHWNDSHLIPWEMFAYGEYIGPHRTPHVPEYRIRVDDSIEFVYLLTRAQTSGSYQINVGDALKISSAIDSSLNQPDLTVISDGTISMPLIGQVKAAKKTVVALETELNEKYLKFVKEPAIIVQVLRGDTPLQDLRDSVDARFGAGGQSRQATVSPDGTVQLPLIGSIPAVGLTLDEIQREVNARYANEVIGIEVTPILAQRAPRYIYVVGQVGVPGRFELVGPTTVMQAIALAQGDLDSANLRNIVIFRRDEQWRLMATRLDLSGALYGRRPYPSDEFFLRDSDIVLLPRKPIRRLSEAVNQYFTETLYRAVPREIIWNFDSLGTL